MPEHNDAGRAAENERAEGAPRREPHVAVNAEVPGGPLFPWNSVVGVIDDPDELDAAVQELVAAGFGEPDVNVLSGDTGEYRIDAGGKRHGLIGRIFRKLHSLGDEAEHTQRHVEELQAGHYVVVIRNPPHDLGAERASAILQAHGGHFIYYYTRMTSRELAP